MLAAVYVSQLCHICHIATWRAGFACLTLASPGAAFICICSGGGSVADTQNDRALIQAAEAFVKFHIEQLDVDASHDWW